MTDAPYERDFVQLAVSQEPGIAPFSSAIADVRRELMGGSVTGDGDDLPIVKIADSGSTIAATAMATVRHPPDTEHLDRAGEGLGEFAVVCAGLEP